MQANMPETPKDQSDKITCSPVCGAELFVYKQQSFGVVIELFCPSYFYFYICIITALISPTSRTKMPASVSLSLFPQNVLILLLFVTEFRGILKRQASQSVVGKRQQYCEKSRN
jgi:hypothetical protein